MDSFELMKSRHSVRSYTDTKLKPEVIADIQKEIDSINQRSGLHFQLITDEPKAFSSFLAHYGKFSGVKNYIALIGKDSSDFQEKCGYYGEELVLYLQSIGLNTCWAALTFKKIPGVMKINSGEKLACVIAVGYGTTNGSAHKSKTMEQVSNYNSSMPEWFKKGVEAALLAPTAVNQQKFYFEYKDGRVLAKPGSGFYTKMDLGIAKKHFELGAGRENICWEAD